MSVLGKMKSSVKSAVKSSVKSSNGSCHCQVGDEGMKVDQGSAIKVAVYQLSFKVTHPTIQYQFYMISSGFKVAHLSRYTNVRVCFFFVR